uniref:Serine protease n=1 Tax=Neogobius melanostomus TaxID=47308 RepID=A0A8C6SPI8_9GOBI
MAPLQSPTMSMNEVVEFNVVTEGGKNIKRILRNALLRSYKEVTVYGYKGEKVKHALKRDGRFRDIVFDKTCALSEINTNVELSNLVNDLGGKTFEIIMLNRMSPPESQPSSLDESVMNEDSYSSDLDENENHLKQNKEMHEIPGSEVFRSHLLSLVSDFIKQIFTTSSGQVSGVRDLLCVEHGRSQGSFTASAMTELMTSLKHSVCQVRIKGRGVGSGFLLFDTFVLTNYHVIKDVFNSMTGQLFEIVTADFAFDGLGDRGEEHQVQEIVAFEYGNDASGHKCDWALLSLTADPQLLPGSLLPHCGFRRQSDSICIIGHPGGNVKMVDLTWVIPVDHREQIIERHFNKNLKDSETVSVIVSGEVIQFVTSEFANSVAKKVSNTRDFTYDTCFYHGASGSPVFDSNCNVVAMHSGGYAYKHSSGEIQSVIEYGHPLSSILENLIVQLVHRCRLDVLKKYLEFPYKHHEFIKHNVKKLVDSRNDKTFKSAINNLNIWNDYTLKTFFLFICQTDSPVPMVTE